MAKSTYQITITLTVHEDDNLRGDEQELFENHIHDSFQSNHPRYGWGLDNAEVSIGRLEKLQ